MIKNFIGVLFYIHTFFVTMLQKVYATIFINEKL